MEPPDRKKRVLIVLAVLAGMVAFMGNFFWGMFKDIRGPQASGHPVSYIPQLMFGGFFLVMIVSVVFSVTRGLRQLQNPASATAPRVAHPIAVAMATITRTNRAAARTPTAPAMPPIREAQTR